MKKRICMLFMVMVMVFGSVMSYAAVVPPVEPQGNPCYCGGNMSQYGVTKYGSWYLTGETRECKHNKTGDDARYTRSATKDYKCTSCGRTFSRVTYEYKWECKGYTR